MGLDRRDPQKLGELVFKYRPMNDWEAIVNLPVADYGLNESMQTVATEAYQQELKEKAAAGDRYAQRILDEQRS